MKVFQIDWVNPSAPPSFIPAENISDAAMYAQTAYVTGIYNNVPADTRGVASVSLLGELIEKRRNGAMVKAADCA